MNEQPPPVPAAAKTSVLAIASLVLGILSVFCFGFLTAIPAIILGIVALVKINRAAGAKTGQGLAIAGLATGGVGLIFGTAILAALLLPAVANARERALRAACMSNERQIALVYLTYQQEHNGQAPQALDDLRKLVGNDQVFHCPADRDPGQPSYQLMPGGKVGDIILREKPGNHRRGGNVAYGDGHVEFQRTVPDR